jgi:hypothetical protein
MAGKPETLRKPVRASPQVVSTRLPNSPAFSSRRFRDLAAPDANTWTGCAAMHSAASSRPDWPGRKYRAQQNIELFDVSPQPVWLLLATLTTACVKQVIAACTVARMSGASSTTSTCNGRRCSPERVQNRQIFSTKFHICCFRTVAPRWAYWHCSIDIRLNRSCRKRTLQSAVTSSSY